MRRHLMISTLAVSVTILVFALIWVEASQSLELNTSEEADAIREVIRRSRRVLAEAEYTFNTEILATVYINDPRGGEVKPETLALIQEMLQDPTLQADQVGQLDGKVAVILRFKRNFEAYITELEWKESQGSLTNSEREILQYVRTGVYVPFPDPTPDASAFLLTPPAEPFQENDLISAYPVPPQVILPLTALYPQGTATTPPYPVPDVKPVVDATPKPSRERNWIKVPYRGINPELLTEEELVDIDILSVKIDGEVAKAIVYRSGVTSEMTLVKVDGQWYIAGGKLLKFAP